MFPAFYSAKNGSDQVKAKNGIISARHPQTAAAGLKVLQNGGNAVDASVTAAFAACVVEPYMTGVGGGGDAVVHLAQSRESFAVDFWGTTPRRMKPGYYDVNQDGTVGNPILSWASVKGDENMYGHKSAVVPGIVAGLSEMLEKFGTITLADALAPAIGLAEEGTIADFQLSALIGLALPLLSKDPDMARIFLRDNMPLQPWSFKLYDPDRLVQRELAATLRKIAKGGRDAFYRGEISESIASDMEAHSGLIDEQELSGFKPFWTPVTPGDYRGHSLVYLPGGGGTLVTEMLNVLEGYDLKEYNATDPKMIHLLVRAVRLGFNDMLQKMGGEPSPELLERLASKGYAADLRARIETPVPISTPTSGSGNEHTTSLTVIDKNRNTVAMTTSLGLLFGSGAMVPGTGINLNDFMICSDPIPGRALSIRPGERQFFPTTPMIVLKNDRPYIAATAAGGCRIMTAVMRVVSNVIDFDMDIASAQSTPRVTQPGRDVGPTFIDSRIPFGTINQVREMGDEVVAADPEFSFGVATGIVVDYETSELHGAAERLFPPYGLDGVSLGY